MLTQYYLLLLEGEWRYHRTVQGILEISFDNVGMCLQKYDHLWKWFITVYVQLSGLEIAYQNKKFKISVCVDFADNRNGLKDVMAEFSLICFVHQCVSHYTWVGCLRFSNHSR